MKQLLKLTIASMIILINGMAIMVLSPEEAGVKDATADISSFDFGGRSPAGKFVDTLDTFDIDFEPYVLNGNVVFFGEKRIHQTPRQIMADFQREFVAQKINAEPRLDVGEQTTKAQLEGEIVPYMISDDRVVLAGATLNPKFENLHDQIGDRNGPNLGRMRELAAIPSEDVFQGYHWIEIVQDRPSSSHVTVSFSADDFDYKKQFGTTQVGIDTDTEVPACRGCERVSRFRAVNSPYENTIYAGYISLDNAQRFYIDSLQRREWKKTDSSEAFSIVKEHAKFQSDDARLLQYARDGRFLSLLIYVDNQTGKTIINSTLSD